MKITRKYKRNLHNKINFFDEFLRIKNHFFKDLSKKLVSIKDNKHQGYINYPPEIILFMVIMKNVTGIVRIFSTRHFNNLKYYHYKAI